MGKKKSPGENPYKVIAKIGEFENNPDGSRAKGYPSVTYRTGNLVSMFAFLKKTYPGFKFMNVIDRKTKLQIASFTINNPPTSARIKRQ